MGSIERRKFLKAATVVGAALSLEGTASLLAPNRARAQGTPTPAASSWPNRRLLDLLKLSVKWSGRKGLVE
jgi:TAT (twin-arginine translocation) pathway signal sequence